MNQVQIGIRENRSAFAPGDEIAGAVLWEGDEAPKSAELRFLWFTRGKGTDDLAVVQKLPFPDPQAGDTRPFSFTAPEAPYSFSGKLISLIWALELILQPGDRCARTEIVIAPEGREIALPSGPPTQPPKLRRLSQTTPINS